MPDFAHLLPEPIRTFTQPAEIHDAEHLSFIQGGGHGGSHPHLVNEFVTALVEEPRPVAERGALAPTGPASASAPTSRPTKGGEIVQAAGVHAGVK